MVDTRPMALERARKRAAERKAQRDALQENSPVQTGRPAGNGFESERQRAKTELRNELEAYDGTGVHKIAASADRQQEDRILNVAAYCRVSTDDIEQTISIEMQKKNYREMIRANPRWRFCGLYVDDGYTGTNFNRPAMQELLSLVEAGQVGTIIVKDMSRFGRDYLQVGHYTEIVFPSMNVRFIAVNDGVDSEHGDSDFTPVRNLFNDFYAKDTSRKVRAVIKAKGMRGEHLNRPPYGYLEDPMRKGHWIIDPETAPVVRRIFDLAMQGKGPESIASILEKERILMPSAVYNQRQGNPLSAHPYHWSDATVCAILERIEYTGCTCNFKTYSKSYKLKKRIHNKPEDMVITENTQEAIVPKELWDRVQELRQQRHRSIQRAEREGMFAGITYCADCGGRMHFATCKSFEGKQDHYRCSSYKDNRGECTCHYIREEVLRDIVLERIRAVTAYVREDAEGFQQEWMQSTRKAQDSSIQQNQKQLAQAKKRLEDIDKLITRLYEDHVLGTLSDDRYQKMMADYRRRAGAAQDRDHRHGRTDRPAARRQRQLRPLRRSGGKVRGYPRADHRHRERIHQEDHCP